MSELRTIPYPRSKQVAAREESQAVGILPVVAACIAVGIAAGAFTVLLLWITFRTLM